MKELKIAISDLLHVLADCARMERLGPWIVRIASSDQSDKSLHTRSLELLSVACCAENPSLYPVILSGPGGQVGLLAIESSDFSLKQFPVGLNPTNSYVGGMVHQKER